MPTDIEVLARHVRGVKRWLAIIATLLAAIVLQVDAMFYEFTLDPTPALLLLVIMLVGLGYVAISLLLEPFRRLESEVDDGPTKDDTEETVSRQLPRRRGSRTESPRFRE